MTGRPYPPITNLSDLQPLSVKPTVPGGGQSLGIWRLPCQDLLFKWYNPEGQLSINGRDLDRLIGHPVRLADQADREVIAQCTAWPVSRVVDGGQTVGVIIKAAPDAMNVTWSAKQGTEERTGPINVDFLAKDDAYLQKRGITVPTETVRKRLCTDLVRIAALLERHGIVYADWSYKNAFWHPELHQVFLIDLDGCSFGPRPFVETANFAEPIPPNSGTVDKYTDRYRAALLIARMYTARREIPDVRTALMGKGGQGPRLLLHAIDSATQREDRPTLTDLYAAFVGSGVSPVRPRSGAPATKRAPSGVGEWRLRNNASSGNIGPPLPRARSSAAASSQTQTYSSSPASVRGVVFGLLLLAALVALCVHLF